MTSFQMRGVLPRATAQRMAFWKQMTKPLFCLVQNQTKTSIQMKLLQDIILTQLRKNART